MGAINLPYNIQNDGPLDADQVMANYQAITTVCNGLLEADTNILVEAPPASILGNVNLEGTASFLTRADHQHVIQGVENATSLPTSNNFLGRLVYITGGVQTGKLMMCTDATNGVFIAVGNPGATDLVIHAAQHADGGHDPLPDNIITDHMRGTHTIQSIALGSTSADFSTSGWTLIIDLPGVATTNQQMLLVTIQGRIKNSNSGANNFQLRVLDHTAADAVIWQTGLTDLGVGNAISVGYSFFYLAPAGGTRTLRLQGAANLINLNMFAATASEKTINVAVI